MIIKFFWVYIGSIMAFSIVLVMLAKHFSQGFAGNGKKPIVFGSLSAVVASGVAYLSTLVSDHLFAVYWVLAGVFLLFGLAHVYFFRNKFFYYTKQNRSQVFLAEILFGFSLIFFTIVIFSTLQYFLKDKNFLFFPMLMSMLLFFLPVMVLKTFEAAYNIPAAKYHTWVYPVYTPIELPDERPNEKLLVIAFEVTKKASEKIKTNFRAKGPDNMLLGDLYYHFLNDYNETQSETPIQFTDEIQEPFEWGFRVKPKWYQYTRILDPEVTVRENNIKENTIIICERLI